MEFDIIIKWSIIYSIKILNWISLQGFNTDHCNNYTDHCRISCKGEVWRLFISPRARAPSQSQAQTDTLSLIHSILSEVFISLLISTKDTITYFHIKSPAQITNTYNSRLLFKTVYFSPVFHHTCSNHPPVLPCQGHQVCCSWWQQCDNEDVYWGWRWLRRLVVSVIWYLNNCLY